MEKNDNFVEKLVHINRITKVVKGGRRFGFSALVVVGNQNGKIGIAHAKAKQVPDAIKKANELARRKLIHIPVYVTWVMKIIHIVSKPQTTSNEKVKMMMNIEKKF